MLDGDGSDRQSSGDATASAEHLKPLAKVTLPQEIVASIVNLIMTRVWKPGDRIPPEKELTSRFGVGRSSLREAIQSLVILGVIEARPGDGSYIRAGTSELLSGAFEWGLLLGEQNLDDLVAMRVLIEVECAGRAAAARDAGLARTLMGLVDEMRALTDQPQAFMRLDNRFHETIAAGAGNTLYLSLSKTIQRLVGVWYTQTYELERTKSATFDEHFAIAKAIEQGSAPQARKFMREHIQRAAERLRRVLAKKS
jgi:GntR family transcriptional regulator, transcriptional repressor for pyruvate dehydrogenase complex